MVAELTGNAASTQEQVIDDEFSKKMFGNSVVTITTTTVDDQAESGSESEEVKPRNSQFFGQKNVKLATGKAEKTLRRLLEKKKGKGGKLGAGARQGKRKKGKTGAKERRRRK